MLSTLILVAICAICTVACVVIQVVMIVQGFKLSVKWGLVSLLVPFGALAFAFAKSGRRKLAVAFLALIVAGAGCGVPGLCRLAKAFAPSDEAAEAGKKGFREFDDKTQDLDNLSDLKL